MAKTPKTAPAPAPAAATIDTPTSPPPVTGQEPGSEPPSTPSEKLVDGVPAKLTFSSDDKGNAKVEKLADIKSLALARQLPEVPADAELEAINFADGSIEQFKASDTDRRTMRVVGFAGGFASQAV